MAAILSFDGRAPEYDLLSFRYSLPGLPQMKAFCASVNLNLFVPKTPSAARAAELEFFSFGRSRKPEARQAPFAWKR